MATRVLRRSGRSPGGFDFVAELQRAQAIRDRGDALAAADARARVARSDRSAAVAAARALRLDMLAAEVERAARLDPMRLGLVVVAWARASGASNASIDDLIAAARAATDEGGGDAVG